LKQALKTGGKIITLNHKGVTKVKKGGNFKSKGGLYCPRDHKEKLVLHHRSRGESGLDQRGTSLEKKKRRRRGQR